MAEYLATKAFITIKPIGFNESDRIKFESLLTIANNMLSTPWQVTTEAIEADFYLVVSSLKSKMTQDGLLSSLPWQKCIFYAEEKTGGHYHEILVDRNNMPYFRSLLELLKSISSSIIYDNKSNSNDTPFAKEDTQQISILKKDYFDPEQGFIGLLLARNKEPFEYYINAKPAIDRVYVDATNKVYYCNSKLENLEAYFTENTLPIQREITQQQLQQIISDNNLKPIPLTNLLWYGAFMSSKGRLIKGGNNNNIVRLKRWPDINLPGSRKLIKLAAFMQSNAVDIDTVQQQTGFSIDQIYNFFNACKIIDLIEHSEINDIHKKNLDAEQRQLLAMIGRRLNQGNSTNE